MQIAIIAALSTNRVIGCNNSLPWHLSADLKRFRRLTMGKPILMGRKTFDSIGRPLPGRINIVISKNAEYQPKGCVVCHSLNNVMEKFNNYPVLMVIGGATLYESCFPLAHKLYLTQVHYEVEGDTYFPAFDAEQWQLESNQYHLADSKNPFNYSFLVYKKIA